MIRPTIRMRFHLYLCHSLATFSCVLYTPRVMQILLKAFCYLGLYRLSFCSSSITLLQACKSAGLFTSFQMESMKYVLLSRCSPGNRACNRWLISGCSSFIIFESYRLTASQSSSPWIRSKLGRQYLSWISCSSSSFVRNIKAPSGISLWVRLCRSSQIRSGWQISWLREDFRLPFERESPSIDTKRRTSKPQD